MMKKLLVSLLVLCALAGCSGGASAPSDSSGEVTDADVVEVTQEAVDTEAEEHVDEIDLTMMSPTMLFAEVVNMTRTPKKYDGAMVTLRGGLMILAVDLETGVGSYSCYVEDATKCCQRGIGFTEDGYYMNGRKGITRYSARNPKGESSLYDEESLLELLQNLLHLLDHQNHLE